MSAEYEDGVKQDPTNDAKEDVDDDDDDDDDDDEE